MNHEALAARVEHIAMATGIIAGITGSAATIATPEGLTAVGVWLGFVDEPLVVTLAPIFGTLATATGTISGFTYFYAKWQKRRIQNQSASENPRQTDK